MTYSSDFTQNPHFYTVPGSTFLQFAKYDNLVRHRLKNAKPPLR